jgi:hypothetical protein
MFRQSTHRFNETDPEFFLATESYTLNLSGPRACWPKARLKDNVRDDYMLVQVVPPVIGQKYGLGEDIFTLILFSKLAGTTLFPVTEWPCPVYVTRILDESITKALSFGLGQVELISWGIIFRTYSEANDCILRMTG